MPINLKCLTCGHTLDLHAYPPFPPVCEWIGCPCLHFRIQFSGKKGRGKPPGAENEHENDDSEGQSRRSSAEGFQGD